MNIVFKMSYKFKFLWGAGVFPYGNDNAPPGAYLEAGREALTPRKTEVNYVPADAPCISWNTAAEHSGRTRPSLVGDERRDVVVRLCGQRVGTRHLPSRGHRRNFGPTLLLYKFVPPAPRRAQI
jgi:hypothetical protein